MRRGSAVAAIALAAAPGVALAAAPGDLDPAFGTGGQVSIPSPQGALTTDASGRVLAAPPDGDGQGLAVQRYLSNGTLDTSFGQSGAASIALAAGSTAQGSVISVQSDGKIVVGGQLTVRDPQTPSGGDPYLAIARYDTDGSPDTTFGAGTGHPGYVTTDLDTVLGRGGVLAQRIVALVPDSNGRLVALASAAWLGLDVVAGPSGYLLRYGADGSLDTSFGSDHSGSVEAGVDPTGLVVEPDGRIVTAGFDFAPGGSSSPVDGALLGFSATGDPDSGFGTGGKVVVPTQPTALVRRSDGSLVTIGAGSSSSASAIVLAAVEPDGSPVPGFGSGGIAVDQAPTSRENARGAAYPAFVDSADRIVYAESYLARFSLDGAFDPTFGYGGIAPGRPLDTTVGNRSDGLASAANGSILAAWTDNNAASGDISQYLSSGTPRTYALSVSRGGWPVGTVSGAGGAIDCGSSCSAQVAYGSPVTLRATPSAGSRVGGWSVPGCGTATTCAVTPTPGLPGSTVAVTFVESPPAAAARATISGTARVGSRLTAVSRWSGAGISLSYRWQRCAPACADLTGATGRTFRGSARGQRYRVVVTARNAAGSAASVSAETPAVAASVGQVRSLLSRALRARGYRYRVRTLGAGRLTITWTAGRTRVARGSVRFTRAKTITVRVRLTGAGRRLLRRRPGARITVRGVYAPAGVASSTMTRTTALDSKA